MGKGGARLGKFLKGSGKLYDPVDLERIGSPDLDSWTHRQTLSGRVASWFQTRRQSRATATKYVDPGVVRAQRNSLLSTIRTEGAAGRPAALLHRDLRDRRIEAINSLRNDAAERRTRVLKGLSRLFQEGKTLNEHAEGYNRATAKAHAAHAEALDQLSTLHFRRNLACASDVEQRIDRAIHECLDRSGLTTIMERVHNDERRTQEDLDRMLLGCSNAFVAKRQSHHHLYEGELESMKTAYLARIADLDAVSNQDPTSLTSSNIIGLQMFEAEHNEHNEKTTKLTRSFEQLVQTDSAMAMEIATNSKTIDRLKSQCEQLREAQRTVLGAEEAQKESMRQQVASMVKFFHQLQATVAHWRKSADNRLRELSMTTFQVRTKVKGVANKAERIIRRHAVATKLERNDDPGVDVGIQSRINHCRLTSASMRISLEELRRENRRLVAELTSAAFRKGTPLHTMLETRHLVHSDVQQRKLTRSRSSMM